MQVNLGCTSCGMGQDADSAYAALVAAGDTVGAGDSSTSSLQQAGSVAAASSSSSLPVWEYTQATGTAPASSMSSMGIVLIVATAVLFLMDQK